MKAEGPSGPAKIRSDDPKRALGLAEYLRAIGYRAWIEDTNGKAIDEKALKIAIRCRHEDAPPPDAAHRLASAGERCRPSAAPRFQSVNGLQDSARPSIEDFDDWIGLAH